jgi:dTDP-glucose 4,6-dehydratase
LGSHLSDRWLERGADVVVVDNLVTGDLRNLDAARASGRLEFVNADVSEGVPVDGDVDWLFHFASPASPVDFTRRPFDVLRVGSVGTLNALEFAHERGAKFFMASTSEVYGDPEISPQPETYLGKVNPIGPRAVYDEGKRFSEAAVMAYHRHKGLDTRIVRFFNTYGPRMRADDGRVVPNFVMQALRNEPITVYGEGTQTRSFGYVDDSIEGVLRLADSDCTEPVNIGSQWEFTVVEFARLVIQLTGSKSEIVHLPPLPDDPRQRRPDTTRALERLDWKPTTSLEDGLRATIEYFRLGL